MGNGLKSLIFANSTEQTTDHQLLVCHFATSHLKNKPNAPPNFQKLP
jgi:predicted metal-binding protein